MVSRPVHKFQFHSIDHHLLILSQEMKSLRKKSKLREGVTASGPSKAAKQSLAGLQHANSTSTNTNDSGASSIVPIKYLKEVNRLKKTIPDWDHMFDADNDDVESRIGQMIRVEVIGQSLCEKYSWAIPDERALRIIHSFSPIIEIGCGKGYWAYLLQQRGVDIVAFDIFDDGEDDDKGESDGLGSSSWFDVQYGGPEVLGDEAVSHGRTLLLCYPDEGNSLAKECLDEYEGDYVIHVGELNVGGAPGTLSSPQAPWGRTTSAAFQVALAEEFHCLLNVAIPRYPFSKDCLTVWKRTQWVEGKPAEEDDEEEGEGDSDDQDSGELRATISKKRKCQGNEEGSDGDDDGKDSEGDRPDNMWAAIPPEERLPTDIAAPCLSHLLS
jgi:hypothetical protein